MKYDAFLLLIATVAIALGSTVPFRVCATTVSVPSSNRTLVVAAHPDDIETICGGLVFQLVKQGTLVRYVLATSGEHGYGKDVTTSPGAVAAMREQEQTNAADVLGVDSVRFLRFPDGALDAVPPMDVKRAIAIQIREFRPDLVLTFNPYMDFQAFQYGVIHRDHVTVGARTLDAVYPLARDWRALPDLQELGVIPHVVPMVWLFGFHDAPLLISLDDLSMAAKQKALLQHTSQYVDPAAVVASLVQLAQVVANSSQPGVPAVKLAEGYTAVPQL
eukprot:ANDGO_07333.mRNA.1 Diacetylchitobiose deacetylase